ncbi:AI-2E family transporter [Fusibacter ferrireducens]|uniref:AI-2E family transporter n=1 Tax=Fusibacter ferrireducens TaxID=2785058 RepID=A0ABR9ZN42_9FIRM|nr:AI-2E family transporter [Fusibacter ferrireducens]MBF4691856.1 AI-2E family transporter [Fusibacter ferrireducens]
MNFKDINIYLYARLIAIAAIVVLVLTKTPIWHMVEQGLRPVIYAFIIAYILDYSVRYFEKKFKINRIISIIITFAIFISIIVLFGALVVPRVVETVSILINSIGNVDINLDDIFNQNFNNIYLNEIQKSIVNALTPMLQKLTNATGTAVLLLMNEIQKITSGLISFVVALIISVYMLAEKNDLVARLKRLIFAYFDDQQSNWIMNTSKKAHYIFKDFVVGKLLDSFIIGVLSFVVLSIFDFEFKLLIAIIIGVTNMIPYFGPFLGAIPASIITYIGSPHTPFNVLWILLIILIIQQLDGWVIGPMILGDSVGVSAFWIILAVTIGGATFGVVGMFLGVPVLVLIKTLLEDDIQKKLYVKGYEGLEEKNIKTKRKSKS